MNDVICGICGTQYSGSLEECPLCGTPKSYRSVFSDEEERQEVSVREEAAPAKKRRIFNFDEVNQEVDVDPEEDFDEEYEEEPELNTKLVVVLVILIALLLLAVGFVFFRFLLPNIVGEEETLPAVTTAPAEMFVPVDQETEPVETIEETVPCTDLSIPGGKVELAQKGQFWLLNVQVFPQDTTDVLTFSSGDENVVTVDEDGKVTAVGEGKTVVHIICGSVKMDCAVTVDFSLEEKPSTEEIVPTLSVENVESETVPEATVPEETIAEETEVKEENKTDTAVDSAAEVLKLKKTDITMNTRYGSVQLELDCDIPADQVEWLTMDSSKAIVIDGLVTATGAGTTTVKAMYKGQVAECIVRCNFG